MPVHPTFSDFKKCFEGKKGQVVWTNLVSDLDTPVSALLKLGAENKYISLLESVEGGSVRGRYSFISLKPDLIWKCHGEKAEVKRNPEEEDASFSQCEQPTLNALRSLIEESKLELPEELPPMAAGLIGYLGYDTVRLTEDIPDKNPDTINIPDGLFMRPTIMVVFDSVTHTIKIVTPVRWTPQSNAEGEYLSASQRLNTVILALNTDIGKRHSINAKKHLPTPVPISNVGRDGYHDMVNKAKEYIRKGDVFQVVPSQRLTQIFSYKPFSLYRSLRILNPSPFLFFLNFENFSIIGSSPEILVRVRNGNVTIRPIAGTRPRGKNAEEDKRNAEELLGDPKEIAEHLMLLDLGRNDVGRVTSEGSVRVTEHMEVEYYSHVMHIVSNVEGKLREDCDPIDALMSGFPAGTVSGAPKVRAMEIIDELESEKRSFYAGAIGYISVNGDIDTCIALRTALVKDGKLIVQAGGGVVADSDPEDEFQESLNKAKAILKAAEQAGNYGT